MATTAPRMSAGRSSSANSCRSRSMPRCRSSPGCEFSPCATPSSRTIVPSAFTSTYRTPFRPASRLSYCASRPRLPDCLAGGVFDVVGPRQLLFVDLSHIPDEVRDGGARRIPPAGTLGHGHAAELRAALLDEATCSKLAFSRTTSDSWGLARFRSSSSVRTRERAPLVGEAVETGAIESRGPGRSERSVSPVRCPATARP